MKRQLTFDYADNMYSIFEDGTKVFSIDPKDMKFDSLKFYEGIYKAKSSSVSLACSESIDSKGKYIFAWVDSIIQHISDNCGEESDSVDTSAEVKPIHKIIKLFDLPSCAGNGNIVDNDSGEEFETDNTNADFAVKISGQSMEPNIPDQSIVLVKKYEGEDCSDGEVYIIEYEGNVMCKRFKKLNRGANFVADNQDKSYIKINAKQIGNCRIQGHVIELIKT